MAGNPLTNGQPSGAGETSTSPAQSWDASQNAILAGEMAAQAAAQRVAEAANSAAKRRTSSGNPSAFEATGNLTVNAHGSPSLGVPRARGKRGK